ncbi:MAG: carboxymuconolactone decarboxylase family protein [Acetobacteraceae bacterium]
MARKKMAPPEYWKLKKQYPDYIGAVEALGAAVRQAGPLDEKTMQLVQLGAAAAIRSEGAVHSHVRRALEAGATTEEIRHAVISVTSTIGFPNVRAALSWADDVLGKMRARYSKDIA